MPRIRSTMVTASVLALALAGCNKSGQDMSATTAGGLPPLPAAVPMQAGPPTAIVAAPPVASLPIRRAVGIARPTDERAAYAYIDRASDIEDEIGDAPPDYDYEYEDGVTPYVWETGGGDYRYAEPTDRGYRYYYYQPGADYPYLIRTHDYSYAYSNGALVAVYTLAGALLPPDQYGGYQDQASRYFWRGQQMRQAAQAREHQGVVAANWAAQRAQFSAAQANWAATRAQQAEWQAYHAQNDPSQQPGWQQEQQQRHQVAQQFNGWQSRGLQGAAPAVLAAVGAHAALAQRSTQPGTVPNTAHPVPLARVQPVPAPQGFAGSVPGRPAEARPLAAVPPAPPPVRTAPARTALNPGIGAPLAHQPAAAPAAHQQQLAAAAHQQQLAAAQHQEQLAAAAHEQQLGAAHTQQLAAARAAQQQELAARQQQLIARQAEQQRAEQQARAAHQQAAAEQQIANVHRQEALAAQQQIVARQQVQQHAALEAAHQAQLHALAAQRQAEIAGQRQAEAARLAAPHPEAPHMAPHPEAPHPADHPADHPAPGHENDHHAP